MVGGEETFDDQGTWLDGLAMSLFSAIRLLISEAERGQYGVSGEIPKDVAREETIKAVKRLALAGSRIAAYLENIKPDEATEAAGEVEVWPINVSDDPGFDKIIKARVRDLKIGYKLEPYDVARSRRKPSLPKTIATKLTKIVFLFGEWDLELDRIDYYYEVCRKQIEWGKNHKELHSPFALEGNREFGEKAKTNAAQIYEKLQQAMDDFALFIGVSNPWKDYQEMHDVHLADFSLIPVRRVDVVSLVEWADRGVKLLLSFTDKHPERCPKLEKIGLKRGDQYKKLFGTDPVKTRKGNIKSGIVFGIKDAFEAIAFKQLDDRFPDASSIRKGLARMKRGRCERFKREAQAEVNAEHVTTES